MADAHYEVSETLTRGARLMTAVRNATIYLASLDDELAAMTTMKDGDGSQAAHFATVTTLYGTGSDESSKSIFDELSSSMGNSAAFRQFLARMG